MEEDPAGGVQVRAAGRGVGKVELIGRQGQAAKSNCRVAESQRPHVIQTTDQHEVDFTQRRHGGSLFTRPIPQRKRASRVREISRLLRLLHGVQEQTRLAR